jgi:hypothetical protein
VIRPTHILLAALVPAIVFAYVSSGPPRQAHPLEAFVTYYCGGAAVRAGVDPYEATFVSKCEHSKEPGLLPAGVVEPAVLPPPALAGFSLVSIVPYPVAGVLFITLLLGALLGAAWLLADVAGLRVAVPLGALAFLCGFVNLNYGEIVPIVLLGICLGGWALTKERYALAAAGLGLAMVEPHVALPAALAAFIRFPQMRLPLLTVAAILISASFALGPQSIWHYAHDVIPLQAWAEIPATDQYSSTWIAHWLGASDRTALAVGSVFSLVGWIAGIIVAMRVADRMRAPAAIAFVPVAFALVLPVFVHDLQLPLAIPAGLLLASRGRYPAVAWVGVMLTAFPWVPGWFWHPTDPLLLLAAFALAYGASVSEQTRLVLAASLIAAYVALDRVLGRASGVLFASNAPAVAPKDANVALASVAWGRYIWSIAPSRAVTLGTLVGKALLFAGPLSVAVAAVLEAYRTEPAVLPVAREPIATSPSRFSAVRPDGR